MAVSGMASMMKALGLDPEELRANVEKFMAEMKGQAAAINANQARIETKLDEILAALPPRPSSRAILENGVDTGTFITNEKFPQAMIDDVNGVKRDG
jgi:hypothetical protein